jgi:hypothetical protein
MAARKSSAPTAAQSPSVTSTSAQPDELRRALFMLGAAIDDHADADVDEADALRVAEAHAARLTADLRTLLAEGSL